MEAQITTTGAMVLVPVDSKDHVHSLREYRKVLQSSMSPNGSCKAMVTGGGYLEVSNASAALTARLELANPVCKYINNVIAGFTDHGLYSGILLSHLLEQLWKDNSHIKGKKEKIIADFVEELKKFLSSKNICIKFDFDSVQHMLSVVRTIIMSKCPTFLSGMNIDKLCVEIIKVFLYSVDEESNLINRIYTKVESGLNTAISCNGLLYTVSDSHTVELSKEITDVLKILVFVLKLQENYESFSSLAKFKNILKFSVKIGVKIVACQKTVSPEIKLFLRREKIILLERTGTDFTKMLTDLSHAIPISHLDVEEYEIDKMVGNLSSIAHVQFSGRDYLILHSNDVPVATLLVQTSTLLGVDFVKALIFQALAALRNSVVHPLLVIGGGCLEAWLIGQIHHLKECRKEDDFVVLSTWVQRALQSTCSSRELDTIYYHGWREDADHCACGVVGREEVEQLDGTWLTLQEVVNSQVNLQGSQQPNRILRPNVLLESHHQKLQVICTVFETFANMSDIGLIVLESASLEFS